MHACRVYIYCVYVRGHRKKKGPIDIMNLINTLNGHKYGYFLPMGLSSCPFCSSFILNNNNDLRTTAYLSDVNVDVYKYNEIHDLLIGPSSHACYSCMAIYRCWLHANCVYTLLQ